MTAATPPLRDVDGAADPAGDTDEEATVSHGGLTLPEVTVDSYSLELRERGDLIGDQASQTAFRELLDEWRERMTGWGPDPFHGRPSDELSKKTLDRAARSGDPVAEQTIDMALQEFAQRLAHVCEVFLQERVWAGVQRIIVGGGFKQSEIGEQVIALTQRLLHERGIEVELRPLHHEADDGGLIGWVHLAPPAMLKKKHDAILAIDIGGTNVRCGIVVAGRHPAKAQVVERLKWRHADEEEDEKDLIEGIVEMLDKLIRWAKKKDIRLSPFIGVACPGIVLHDGSIARGAQNMPKDWQRASFHLPRRLQENVPQIDGQDTVVLMHNDAVVQGLSELPFTDDVRRWAVLTIGTGLGNASFTNRARSKG